MAERRLSHIPEFVQMQSYKSRKELGQTQLIISYHDAERRSTVEDEENNGNRTFIHVCQALDKHEDDTNKRNRITGCHDRRKWNG